MLKRAYAVALISVVACGGSNSGTPTTPASSTPTTIFTLSGQVADGVTGTGISGATVSIADGPNAGKSSTTDASGNYTLTGLQQSGFTVNVSASNYVPQSKSVTLTFSQTLSFQLTRQTSPPQPPPTPLPSCTYTLSVGSTIDGYPNGGSFSVTVTASNGCTWTAVSTVSWIHVPTSAAGNGSGTFTFTVDPNNSSSARIGTLTIAGKPVAFNQTAQTSSPTSGEDASAIISRCPTPAEIAMVDRNLSLSFESDPTAGSVACTTTQSSRPLTLLQAQAYRVLTITRLVTFDAALPWTSDSLYGWLVHSIRGIRFRGDIGTSFCCDPSGTIDIQTRSLSALQFPTDFRWVGTLIVLFVHEARHNNGFQHDCPDGVNDKTIAELGAWGVQYYCDLFLGTRSNPAFIAPGARSGFVQDAQQTCAVRFCQDRCP